MTRSSPLRRLLATVVGLLAGSAAVVGCAAAPRVVRLTLPPLPVAATAPDGRGALRPLPVPTGCAATVRGGAAMNQALGTAQPGDRICVLGDLSDSRLVLNRSGTAQRPIQVVGDGRTVVKGISVRGDYVTVSGVNALNPDAPGISLFGNHLTLVNSSSLSPRGNDGDALRFWGSYLTIAHNTLRDTHNIKAHADCMQTFATDADHPTSQHVVIDGNRCEAIANTCLIMEGPHSLAGDGSGVGVTTNVVFTNNYCQNSASEALQLDDVRNLTITDNEIAGAMLDHAFALQNNSTGARVSGNTLNRAIHYEVGMDESSAPGYRGPEIGGDP